MSYLEIKNQKTYYNDVDLEKLIKKEQTPIKLVFLDIIENQIKKLKKSFSKAITKNKYKNSFVYLNASKANYASEIVFTATKFSDGAETSSYFDLEMTSHLINNFKKLSGKTIFCNGFKPQNYCDKIVDLHNHNTKIVDIIDSLSELDYLLSKNYNSPLEIGVRVNLEGLYGQHNDHDRFGISKNELKIFQQKLKNQNKLVLTTLHFHQRGMTFDEQKFYENIEKISKNYVELKKEFKSLKNLDIGGGAPWSYDDEIDYDSWADKLIKTFKDIFSKNKIDEPNILMENGKYTTKDCMINLYSVVGVKKTDPKFLWYILDTSLMLAIPEYFMCGEPMKIVPINNLNSKMIKTRLAGITCDCDDVFCGEKGYMLMPEILDKKQYVAILGTGSYQESLTSHKAIRHCLVPSEKRIITFLKNGKRHFVVSEEFDTPEDMFKLLRLNKTYLKQFEI